MNEQLIMIVEDDDDLREALAMIIGMNGFRTIDATDGIDALEKLDEGSLPSLIVLDLRMPRMNGVEFLHAVRDTDAGKIPVVAFTGDAGAAREALQAGANICLRKPIEPRALMEVIRNQLAADARDPARP